ncbi:hypothetical protein SLA2020_377260 [Shorea laevis]
MQCLNWLDYPPILSPSESPTTGKPQWFLAGKVHSMREISKATVRETLQTAWKFLKFLSLESFGNSTYVFTFDNEQDMEKS